GFSEKAMDPDQMKKDQLAFEKMMADPKRVTKLFTQELKTLIARSKPAVVAIRYAPSGPFGQDVIHGTGFFIRKDGLILTNHHVVRGRKNVDIQLLNKQILPAEVLETDPDRDLALIRVKTDKVFPFLPISNEKENQTGQLVISIGHPENQGWNVTMG